MHFLCLGWMTGGYHGISNYRNCVLRNGLGGLSWLSTICPRLSIHNILASFLRNTWKAYERHWIFVGSMGFPPKSPHILRGILRPTCRPTAKPLQIPGWISSSMTARCNWNRPQSLERTRAVRNRKRGLRAAWSSRSVLNWMFEIGDSWETTCNKICFGLIGWCIKTNNLMGIWWNYHMIYIYIYITWLYYIYCSSNWVEQLRRKGGSHASSINNEISPRKYEGFAMGKPAAHGDIHGYPNHPEKDLLQDI